MNPTCSTYQRALHGLRVFVAAGSFAVLAMLGGGCELISDSGDAVGSADSPGGAAGLVSPAATYPTCSPKATDPDGDGWGWEPTGSCIVRGRGLDDPAYPFCASTASDPDGDGWGWEEAHSCQMVGGGPGDCAYVSGACAVSGNPCHIYNDAGARDGVKATIWNTMVQLNTANLGGLPPAEADRRRAQAQCRADLAVAMAMQESHSFAVLSNGNLPYDDTKDGLSNGAQNVCLFNMNIDFIKRSCKTGCGPFQNFANQNEKKYLNRSDRLTECVQRLNEGFNHFGIDGTLYFHRAGSSGWEHPGDDERAFARAEKVVADHLRRVPSFRTNGSRVAHDIEHR
jgi:Cellulose or protein binding domain